MLGVIDLGMLVGRILMAILGAYFWLYALKPQFPLVRSLWWGSIWWPGWMGRQPGNPEVRFFSAALGAALIAAAALIGPPFH